MRARFTVSAGEQVGLRAALGAGRRARRPSRTAPERVAARIEDTVEAWRSWEAEHDIYEGPHRELVRLSSRVLKGLTYRPTGAIVAAPTTLAARDRRRRAQLGLPLRLDPRREPDARGALHRRLLGRGRGLRLVHDQLGRRAGGRAARCRSCTGSAASTTSPSASCRTCAAGATRAPVRVGNGAWGQTQLDVYGELLNALHLYREQLGELHPEIQQFVADLADTAARRWTRDATPGMWEMRGEPRHHLSSKVLCWTALDRAVKLAPAARRCTPRSRQWTAERDAIREAVLDARLERDSAGATRSRSTPTSSTPRSC